MWRFILFLLLPIVVHAQTTPDISSGDEEILGGVDAQTIPDDAPQGEEIGWVTAALNDVQQVPQAGVDVPVTEGTSFLAGTTHKTGAISKLRLLTEDDSIVTLGENTQFQMTENHSGSLSSGIVRAMSGPGSLAQESQFTIHTPTALAIAERGGAYFIVWITDCNGQPATGVLSLDGEVTARAKNAANGVVLSSFFYTKIGEACPPPLPLAVSKEVMAEVTEATALIDPVRVAAVAMEVSEQIDPKGGGERLPVAVHLTPPIAQVPNLSSLGLRVRVIFP